MQIICVSRGTYSGGKDFAEKLAAKLGLPCVSREQLTDAAVKAGITVGKLEMAIVRPRPLDDEMAALKERFLAFITANLAEEALRGGLVYHGRTGHLVLSNVNHVLRVRAILDCEQRVALTMRRLGLDREKARQYNDQVDEDRRRWVRTMYNVNWDNPAHYDVVVNFDHVSVDNAASALVPLAQLPEFRATPASTQTLRNLALAARCRLAVGDDPRTRKMDVKVRAERGAVSVTYHPRHEEAAAALPEILRRVESVSEVTVTTATTNIYWIQDRFEPSATSFDHVVEVAEKWNAAVGLVRVVAAPEPEHGETAKPSPHNVSSEPNAGILDDADDEPTPDRGGGVVEAMDRLIREGRAGGHTTVSGEPKDILRSLDRTAAMSLVVVGDVYSSRGEAVRKRKRSELVSYLSESLRVPVIGAEELESQYLFGAAHWLRLVTLGAITALVVFTVFSYQAETLAFLTHAGTGHRLLAVASLALFVPVFAYVYGTFSQYLLRLLKFE